MRSVTEGRTDKQTDTTNIIVAFLHFANAPKNGYNFFNATSVVRGHAVAQLVETLRYNPEGSRVRFPILSLRIFH